MASETDDNVRALHPDMTRIHAMRQVEELVNTDNTDILIDFLTPEQRKQLAEDFLEGKDDGSEVEEEPMEDPITD